MEAINRIILDKAVSDVEMIPELAHHLIDSGGKRLRPMLTIAAAKLCRLSGRRPHPRRRRRSSSCTPRRCCTTTSSTKAGRGAASKTARMIWGNQASVLVGDFLLGQAFRMMVDVGSLPVLQDPVERGRHDRRRRSDAARRRQEHGDDRRRVSRHHQRQDGGAVLGRGRSRAPLWRNGRPRSRRRSSPTARISASPSSSSTMRSTMRATARRLGKSVGDDFREGKITLPVILSFRRGTSEEREFWNRTIVEGDDQDGDLEHAISLMKRHKAIDATLERARSYGSIARDALAIFPAIPTSRTRSSGSSRSASGGAIDRCALRLSRRAGRKAPSPFGERRGSVRPLLTKVRLRAPTMRGGSAMRCAAAASALG